MMCEQCDHKTERLNAAMDALSAVHGRLMRMSGWAAVTELDFTPANTDGILLLCTGMLLDEIKEHHLEDEWRAACLRAKSA